jgi:hypothetical protein
VKFKKQRLFQNHIAHNKIQKTDECVYLSFCVENIYFGKTKFIYADLKASKTSLFESLAIIIVQKAFKIKDH